MALVLADRVLETTTTTGSGTITLAGAEPGYQSFSAVGNGNQTYYTITADTVWEVGIGTYTASGTTLSRDTVLSSSASGAKVTLPSGVKKVFVTYPSEKSVNLDVSGNISLSSAVISGVGYPSANSDAATKLYVDTLAAEGISYHTPVKYEVPNTTGNLTATYNNGTAGVSATLTNAGTLGPFVPDGVTASISDRILIYNQTNAVQNGVYVVTTVGTGASSWVLTRAADANTYGVKSPTALGAGDAFYVTSGNTGAGETYVCNTPGTIVFGSTNITFVQVSAAQVYQAGTGISLTNTTISLVSPVAVATGGTGLTSTPTNGQLLIGNGSGYTLSTLTAGSGVSITNSAGSITLTATGTGGTVVAVTASAPLASTGGVSPNISIANTTGTGSVVLDQGATISSATITAGVSAAITTITGTSANITTVTGTTAGFSSANITHAGITSATVTTLSGTNVTYSSGTVSQLAATSATITTLSGTNVTYPNANFTSASITNLALTSLTLANLSITSANVTTLTGTNLTYTSGTVTNLNSTSANITTLTGTTFGTTAATNLRGLSAQITTATVTSADITTLTGTTFGTTATTQLRGASADITTLTGTTFGTTATTNLRGLSAQITTLTATSSNITTLTGTNLTYTSGTITNLAATSITVTNTPAFVGNGTLTMNVSGTGLSGSQTFTANQSSNATFTVTSNATSANTASAIVARDASGNFSAGTITAALNGNASTATSATSATTASNVAATTATGVQSAYQTTINTTTPGLGTYGIHFNGQITADFASGITWNGGTTTTNANAGIYVQGSGSYGTKMYIATTDSYATGSKTAISIDHSGITNFVRARPTALGNTILDAGNYTSYVGNGTLTLNVSGLGLSGSQTFTANQSGNATFTVTSNATTTATANALVCRDANGDDNRRYGFASYFNSSDNAVASGVTAVMVKQGDNYYRSSTAAGIATFISGQTMNIAGNASTVTNGLYTTGNQTIAARTIQQGSQTATLLTATGSLGGLELQAANSSGAAFGTYHRPGAFAAYFGLDTDNQFACGGWSYGAALGNMKVGSLGVGAAASGTAGRMNATGWTTTGRNYSNEWIQFDNYSALYSPLNGAHFYPNNASYGSWRVAGSRNGWNGLEFDSSPGQTCLMISSNQTGTYNTSYGWQYYWYNGTLYCLKNSYGGGTTATVLDSSNYTSYVSGGTLKSQSFTSSGSFTVPSGVTGVMVTMQGGGGGGSSSCPSFNAQGCPGGASGYYVVSQVFSVSPGQVISITIGGGGSGAFSAYYQGNVVAGSSGGASAFGGYSIAGGGGGNTGGGGTIAYLGGRGGRSALATNSPWGGSSLATVSSPFASTSTGFGDGANVQAYGGPFNDSGGYRMSGGAGGLYGAGGNGAFADDYGYATGGSGGANSGAGGGGAINRGGDTGVYAQGGNGGSGIVVVAWIG